MRLTFLASASAQAVCCATIDAMATSITLSFTGAIQTFTVPDTGEYATIVDVAQGAASFQHADGGGLGAEVSGDFFLTAGTVLDVGVGGTGGFASAGGGGSFVYTTANALQLAAGGGGGQSASNSGLGGPGLAGQRGGAGTDNTSSPAACSVPAVPVGMTEVAAGWGWRLGRERHRRGQRRPRFSGLRWWQRGQPRWRGRLLRRWRRGIRAGRWWLLRRRRFLHLGGRHGTRGAGRPTIRRRLCEL